MIFDVYPVAFHFVVMFQGLDPPVPDMGFQEVSGLETEFEVDPLREGGENRFVHQLPKGVKNSNLKLKRGIGLRTSGLVHWCKTTLEGSFAEEIKTKTLLVSLLNEYHIPVAAWTVGNAYPIKWQIGGFDAMKNELAVETIELAYTTLERTV